MNSYTLIYASVFLTLIAVVNSFPQYKTVDEQPMILRGQSAEELSSFADIINPELSPGQRLLNLERRPIFKQDLAFIDEELQQDNPDLADDIDRLVEILTSQQNRPMKRQPQITSIKLSPRMKKFAAHNMNKRHCWNVADVCCMWNICSNAMNSKMSSNK